MKDSREPSINSHVLQGLFGPRVGHMYSGSPIVSPSDSVAILVCINVL